MKIAIGTDHAGYGLKEKLIPFLQGGGHEVIDCGAFGYDRNDDYPDFVTPAAEKVANGEAEAGIVLGYSGQGEAIASNKVTGIRAVVYYGGSKELITLSREHNNANVLSLGAHFIDEDLAKDAVVLWLATSFNGEERHVRRIGKLKTSL